jgi:hypothetical protein
MDICLQEDSLLLARWSFKSEFIPRF